MNETYFNDAVSDTDLLPPLLDEFSYFCKFDQLTDILCNSGGKQQSIKESGYISVDTLFPEDSQK